MFFGNGDIASRREKIYLGLCLLFVLLSSGAYFVESRLPGLRGYYYIWHHILLSVLMLLLFWVGRGVRPDWHRWGLVSGICSRALLLGVSSFTTTDVQRYLWDGHAVLMGIDPYRFTPNQAALLVDPVWLKGIVSGNIVTIYPPGALALYALCAAAGLGVAFWCWKALVTAAAVLTLFFMWDVLKRLSREEFLPIVAFSPLLLLESGVGAHLDVFAGLAVAVALFFFVRKREGLSGVTLGAGALIKFLPFVVLFSLGFRRRSSFFAMLRGAMLVFLAGYGLAFALGLRPLGSLIFFLQNWRFGSPIFSMMETWDKGAIGWDGWTLLFPLLLATLWLSRKLLKKNALSAALSLPLIVSPVVFPWYLTPALIAASLEGSAFVVAWTISLPLSYEVIDRYDSTGVWSTAAWPLWVVALGWGLGWIFDWVSCFGPKRSQEHPGQECGLSSPDFRKADVQD